MSNVKVSKEQEQFEQNLVKIEAILEGRLNINKDTVKVSKSIIDNIVDELAREEKANLALIVKEKFKTLVKTRREMTNEFIKMEQELQKKKDEKYKEFNQAVNAILQSVDYIDTINKEYKDAIEAAAKAGNE